MNKFISAVLTLSASLPITLGWYEAQTNLAYRWENDRAAVEARMVDNYTNNQTGEFDEVGFANNKDAIEQYVDALNSSVTE